MPKDMQILSEMYSKMYQNSEETPAHENRMLAMAEEIEVIARNLSSGRLDEDNIQQLMGIAQEIRKEYDNAV